MPKNEYQAIFLAIIMQIPKGKVASYGQIATLAGYPTYSRHVGNCLKDLPKGTKIPWHRVINGQGKISFPHNSEKYLEQKSRLEKEGISFISGKVNLKHFGWNP